MRHVTFKMEDRDHEEVILIARERSVSVSEGLRFGWNQEQGS